MPTYSKQHEQELISKVKKILVFKPDASIRQIVGTLAENGTSTSNNYIGKLLNKIRGERARRYDNAAAKDAVAKFEDFVKTMNEELLKLNSSTKLDIVKSMTISNIVKNYKMVLDLQFDIGVFEKQLGTIKSEHTDVAEILKLLKNERDTKQNKQGSDRDDSEGPGRLPVLCE